MVVRRTTDVHMCNFFQTQVRIRATTADLSNQKITSGFITCFSVVYRNISVKYKLIFSLFETVKILIWYFHCFEFKPITLFQWNTSMHSTGNQLDVVNDIAVYFYLACYSFSIRLKYIFKRFFAYNKKKICLV
jgi:hypothetical protein